jgi:outer membrane lipase/esterase
MKRLTLGLAALFAFVLSAPASAQYSSLLVFGDSLVDSGNAQLGSALFGLPDPAPAAAGYFQGRFSNGYNFADYLSLGYLGTAASPYLAPGGGLSFGVGGATAAFASPLEIPPSFLSQLTLFQSLGQPIASDALVLVTFGGNDVRDVLLSPDPIDFSATLSGFADGLSALVGAGARNIVVTGIPDIGALPITQAVGDQGVADRSTARALALNAQIEALTANLTFLTDADVEFFDLYSLEQMLRADPGAFGLPAPLETEQTCQQGGVAAVVGGCVGYLYFDPIHPTTQVHQVIAARIAQQLAVPEPRIWAMMIVGFAVVGALARRKRMVAAIA